MRSNEREFIRDEVVNLKEKYNMSFQKIADKLKCQYDISISRQAVCKIYHKAIENRIGEEALSKQNIKDIITYFSLGKTVDEINIILLMKNNIKVLKTDILKVIKQNMFKYNIKKEFDDIIGSSLKNNDNIEDIINKLSYNGIKPNESMVRNLINNYKSAHHENKQ